MNLLKGEVEVLKQAGVPADLNGAALTGARISMKEAKRCAVVINCGDSTGAAFTVSFQQHDAASAGNSKALNVKANYYYKAAAETEFTKVEIRPDSDSLSDSVDLASVFAAQEGIVIFEFLDEHLDTNNGYAWMSVNIADTTAAKIVAAHYELREVSRKPAYELSA